MANIADKIAQIRQAIFGKDVRESIASGIEAINTEVESTTQRQTDLEEAMVDAKQDAEEAAVRANSAASDAEALVVWENYNPDKDYVPMNKVAYQGNSYINMVACKGIAPTNGANWLKIVNKGDQGVPGPMPTLVIGNTTTLAPGSPAAVTRRDGSPDETPIIDFGIPRGVDGTGSGDMAQVIYDTDGDGKVNAADTADTVPDNTITDAKLSDAAGQIMARFTTHTAEYVSVTQPPAPLAACKWDGVTDDTVAFQDIVDYMRSRGGGAITLPKGKGKISSKIVIDFPLSIWGQGSDYTNLDAAAALSNCVSGFLWAGGADTIFEIPGKMGGISWRNFAISGENVALIGIDIDRLRTSTFENIQIMNCVANCIRIKVRATELHDNCMWNVFTNIALLRADTPLLIEGNAFGNICHNNFINLVTDYMNNGIDIAIADNNCFLMSFNFKRGMGGYSLVLRDQAGSNIFFHFQGEVLAKAGSLNSIYHYDRVNGEAQPVIEEGAVLDYTETGTNAELWNVNVPIKQKSIDKTLDIMGRTISYNFSTSAVLTTGATNILKPSGAPGLCDVFAVPFSMYPVALSLTLDGGMGAGSFTVEVYSSATGTAIWSNTFTYPSGNNRIFYVKQNTDEATILPESQGLLVRIVTSADFTAGLNAMVNLIMAI